MCFVIQYTKAVIRSVKAWGWGWVHNQLNDITFPLEFPFMLEDSTLPPSHYVVGSHPLLHRGI